MYDFVVELDTDIGTTLTENVVPTDPIIEIDVDVSGNLVDVWESSLSVIEVLVEGPRGPGYAILDEGEEPPPGTAAGTIFLVRQT